LYKFPLKPKCGYIHAGTFEIGCTCCQHLPDAASSSENSTRWRRK